MYKKTLIKIADDVRDSFLEKGEVFSMKTVHIQQRGLAVVHIIPLSKDGRDRPETLTVEVIEKYCEDYSIPTKSNKVAK